MYTHDGNWRASKDSDVTCRTTAKMAASLVCSLHADVPPGNMWSSKKNPLWSSLPLSRLYPIFQSIGCPCISKAYRAMLSVAWTKEGTGWSWWYGITYWWGSNSPSLIWNCRRGPRSFGGRCSDARWPAARPAMLGASVLPAGRPAECTARQLWLKQEPSGAPPRPAPTARSEDPTQRAAPPAVPSLELGAGARRSRCPRSVATTTASSRQAKRHMPRCSSFSLHGCFHISVCIFFPAILSTGWPKI